MFTLFRSYPYLKLFVDVKTGKIIIKDINSISRPVCEGRSSPLQEQ